MLMISDLEARLVILILFGILDVNKDAFTFSAALFLISIPNWDWAVDFKTLSKDCTESFGGRLFTLFFCWATWPLSPFT